MKLKYLMFGLLALSQVSAFAKVSDFGTLTLLSRDGKDASYTTITNIELDDDEVHIYTANKNRMFAECVVSIKEMVGTNWMATPSVLRAIDMINANIGRNPIHVYCRSQMSADGRTKRIYMRGFGDNSGNQLRVVIGKGINWKYED